MRESQNGLASDPPPGPPPLPDASSSASRRAKFRDEFEDQLIKTSVWAFWGLIAIVLFLAFAAARWAYPSLPLFAPVNDYCAKASAPFWCAVWGRTEPPAASPAVPVSAPRAALDAAAVKRGGISVDTAIVSSYPLMRELLPDFWDGLRAAGLNPAQPDRHGPSLDLRWPASSPFFAKADNGDPDPDHPAVRLDGTWVWLTLAPIIVLDDRVVADLGEVRATGHVPVGTPQPQQAAEAAAARTLGQEIGQRAQAWLGTAQAPRADPIRRLP